MPPGNAALPVARLHVEVPTGVEQVQTAVGEVVVAVCPALGGGDQAHLLVENLNQLQALADEELARRCGSQDLVHAAALVEPSIADRLHLIGAVTDEATHRIQHAVEPLSTHLTCY